MNQETLAKVLNEWLRRYIDEPEQFEHEMTTVRAFLEEGKGGESSYGVESAEYAFRIAKDLGLSFRSES